MLFGDNINAEINCDSVNHRWKGISPDTPLETNKFLGKVVLNRYDKTIEENIAIMNEFLGKIKEDYPNAKIILTLIPRFVTMEKALELHMSEWKKEFESIINTLTTKYGAEFINFKNEVSISGNHRFYNDICHLNTIGGRCLTSLLNQYL